MFIFAFHPDLLVTFTTEKNFLFMLTYMFSRQKKKKKTTLFKEGNTQQ